MIAVDTAQVAIGMDFQEVELDLVSLGFQPGNGPEHDAALLDSIISGTECAVCGETTLSYRPFYDPRHGRHATFSACRTCGSWESLDDEDDDDGSA